MRRLVQRDREDHRHRVESDGLEQRKIHWPAFYPSRRRRAGLRESGPFRTREAQTGRIPRPQPHDRRRLHRQIDHRGRRRRTGAGIDDEIQLPFQRIADRLGIGKRLGGPRENQRRR